MVLHATAQDNTPPPTPRLATYATAAQHVACSRDTIRRRVREGKLTKYRLGGLVRVDLNELEAAFGIKRDGAA